MTFIKSFQGGGIETYDVDFATLTSGAISNGPLVVGGKTWTVSNIASAASFVVGANGLEFSANATNSSFLNNVTRNATRLTIKLDALFPELLPTSRALLRVGWTCPTNDANADYEFCGVQLDSDVAGNSFWVCRGYHAGYGTQTVYSGSDSAGGSLVQVGFNTNWSTHKATAFEMYGMGGSAVSGLFVYNAVPGVNDAVPASSAFTRLGELVNSSPPLVNGWDALYMHLFFCTFNTAAAFTASVRSFRAEMAILDWT
jgi:hypothetical protein